MSPRKFTQIEFDAARQVRDAAKAELWEVCPELRMDAVHITVVPSDKSLDIQGNIVGDTSPYSYEEVKFYMGELGLKLPQA